MTDPHEDVTLTDALLTLDALDGDKYIYPEKAREVVMGFKDVLESELDNGHDAMQVGELWANRYVANIAQMAKDAPGMPSVPQYRNIVLVDDLSAELANDLGVDVGRRMSVGSARSSRERHDGTLDNISEKYNAA